MNNKSASFKTESSKNPSKASWIASEWVGWLY